MLSQGFRYALNRVSAVSDPSKTALQGAYRCEDLSFLTTTSPHRGGEMSAYSRAMPRVCLSESSHRPRPGRYA